MPKNPDRQWIAKQDPISGKWYSIELDRAEIDRSWKISFPSENIEGCAKALANELNLHQVGVSTAKK